MKQLNNNIYNVKLTDKQVYEILYMNKVKGMLPYQIQPMFPVSKGTIKQIVNGKSRKDCYAAFLEYQRKHPIKLKKMFE